MKVFVYIVSSLITLVTGIHSLDFCNNQTKPCTCQNVVTVCKDFERVEEVQNILKKLPSPINTLTLVHNDSIELPEDFFHDICVNFLYFELRQMTHISDSLLSSQEKCLKQLTIKNGRLEYMPIGALLSLKNLYVLIIVNNQIKELNESLRMLNIKDLVLEHNEISIIHSKAFPHILKTLILNGNHIESLNNSLSLLHELYYLSLSDNRIKSLKDELNGLTDLETLIVRDNQIENLDNCLHNLSKLVHLDLSINRIKTLNDDFTSLHNLRKLSLSQNLLTELNDIDFSHLINLEQLDLSSNKINYLGNSLNNLRNLTVLNLNDNRLVEIGNAFNCLNRLTFLYVSRNLLKNLDFIQNDNITERDDDSCHFTKDNLGRMRLSGNPLECSSDIKLTLENLNQNSIILGELPC